MYGLGALVVVDNLVLLVLPFYFLARKLLPTPDRRLTADVWVIYGVCVLVYNLV